MLSALILASLIASSPLSPLLRKMENTEYMTGLFEQTDRWALTLQEETSDGTMHLGRPDLFRLSYSGPRGGATGYDGSVLYTVEDDIEQVIIYPSREPGSFLHLLDRCSDSTLTEVLHSGNDSLVVRLDGEFGEGITSMTVGFTLSDSLPFLFSSTDCNGNRTTYRLREVSTFDDLPDGVFALNVPEGYEVVDPEAM